MIRSKPLTNSSLQIKKNLGRTVPSHDQEQSNVKDEDVLW